MIGKMDGTNEATHHRLAGWSDRAILAGDSGARLTRFRGEREKRSGVKVNGIPG